MVLNVKTKLTACAVLAALAALGAASTAQALIEAGDVKLPPWIHGDGLNSYFPERPLRREISGVAVIHCKVDGRGKLSQCTAPAESPADYGFAQASLAMAPRLTTDLAPAAQAPVKDGAVDIPVSFFSRHAGRVTKPVWVKQPDAGDIMPVYHPAVTDQQGGIAVLRCEVSWAGRLERCVVARQSAPGLGDAALQLAPLFKMGLLDGEGTPVAGRQVDVPVEFRVH